MRKFCGIKVSSEFFLAPMAAFTTLSFRLLCKHEGAGMVFSEMVNATHISRKPEICKTLAELKTCKEEKPIALQLFGNRAEDFPTAAKLLEKNYEMINLNAGCPASDITKIGAGAGLLKEPEKICEIVSLLKKECKKPVSVKLRLGWEKDESARICKMLEEAGADALIVHARTATQMYSGKADWSAVRFLQKNSRIPIVYNGDIDSAKTALEFLEKTGCEFGMIGRSALKNPLIFKEILALQKGKEWSAGREEKLGAFAGLVELCEKHEMLDLKNLKLEAMQITHGFDGAKDLREKIMKAKTSEELREFLKL